MMPTLLQKSFLNVYRNGCLPNSPNPNSPNPSSPNPYMLGLGIGLGLGTRIGLGMGLGIGCWDSASWDSASWAGAMEMLASKLPDVMGAYRRLSHTVLSCILSCVHTSEQDI